MAITKCSIVQRSAPFSPFSRIYGWFREMKLGKSSHTAASADVMAITTRHLHGQAFCIASTARTRKSSCIRSGRASTYVTATRAL